MVVFMCRLLLGLVWLSGGTGRRRAAPDLFCKIVDSKCWAVMLCKAGGKRRLRLLLVGGATSKQPQVLRMRHFQP